MVLEGEKEWSAVSFMVAIFFLMASGACLIWNYCIERRLWRSLYWVAMLSTLAIFLAETISYRLWSRYEDRDVQRQRASMEEALGQPVFSGVIKPGNDRTNYVADQPSEAVAVLLGRSVRVVAIGTRVDAIQAHGIDVLRIEHSAGGVLLSARVCDKTGRYVARIIQNEFQLDEERAFRPIVREGNMLSVRDYEGAEVLHVEYLNTRAMLVRGVFFVDGSVKPLIIDDTGVFFPDGAFVSGFTLTSSAPAGMIAI